MNPPAIITQKDSGRGKYWRRRDHGIDNNISNNLGQYEMAQDENKINNSFILVFKNGDPKQYKNCRVIALILGTRKIMKRMETSLSHQRS